MYQTLKHTQKQKIMKIEKLTSRESRLLNNIADFITNNSEDLINKDWFVTTPHQTIRTDFVKTWFRASQGDNGQTLSFMDEWENKIRCINFSREDYTARIFIRLCESIYLTLQETRTLLEAWKKETEGKDIYAANLFESDNAY